MLIALLSGELASALHTWSKPILTFAFVIVACALIAYLILKSFLRK